MKKKYFLIIFLVFVIGIAYLIKNKRKIANEKAINNAENEKSVLTKRRLRTKFFWNKIANYKGAYSFNIIDSNIYLFCNDIVYNVSINNSKILTTYNAKNAEAAFKISDTTIFFSYQIDAKTLEYYRNRNFIKSVKQSAVSTDIIYNNAFTDFFYTDDIPSKSIYGNLGIKTNKNNFIFDINKAIDSLITKIDSNCRFDISQGNLYNYSHDTIAYLLNKVDAILLINIIDGKYRLLNTISEYKYVPTTAHIVNDKISGMVMMKCEPSTDIEFIHTSLGISTKYLFVKSAIYDTDENNSLCEFIDVYEKFTFKYLYSIKFNLSEKEPDYIVKIEADENNLYALTTKDNFYSLKYNQ